MHENIRWFKGANYYQVRGWLEKRGFKKTNNYGFYDDAKTSGWQEFDDGVEMIILRCKIIRNGKGNLQCDKVYDYYSKIYDSKNMNNFNKSLYESIMKGITKSLRKLNESAFVMNLKNMSYVASFIYIALHDDIYRRLFDNDTYNYFIGKDPDEILNMLYWCNVHSVNYRYNEDTEDVYQISNQLPEYDSMDDLLSEITEVQILKFMHCWHYQSCEKESETLDMVESIMNHYQKFLEDLYGVDDIVDTDMYDEAKWDF